MIDTMMLSIHLPKCAGTSFKESLVKTFEGECFLDYGNLVTNKSPGADMARLKKKRELVDSVIHNNFDYKIVHGHFYATKYLDVVRKPKWITVIRNPVELVPSYYRFLLERNSNGPLFKVAREVGSLEEFASHPWFCNIMTKQIFPLDLEDFYIVSTLDCYKEFCGYMSNVSGREFSSDSWKNVTKKSGDTRALTDDQKKMIEDNNKHDMDLYYRLRSAGGILVNP